MTQQLNLQNYCEYLMNQHYNLNAIFLNPKKSPQRSFRALSIIPFNQENNLINFLDSNYPTLLNFNQKYEGLCELVCNVVLMDDLLSKATQSNSLEIKINLERLNDQKVKSSHILNVYSVFRKVIAYLFGIYPNNIFSCFDQWKLVNKDSTNNKIRKVNKEILNQGLESIEEGETLKLEVFKKRRWSLYGHSLLIKKIALGKYIFFDPNEGEYRNLSISELHDKIDQQLERWEGTDLLFIRGRDYLKRLESR